jgi:hypothetical protein
VKPCEEQQPFEEFIDFVSQQEIRVATSANPGEKEVRYAQTRESTENGPWPIIFFTVSWGADVSETRKR